MIVSFFLFPALPLHPEASLCAAESSSRKMGSAGGTNKQPGESTKELVDSPGLIENWDWSFP